MNDFRGDFSVNRGILGVHYTLDDDGYPCVCRIDVEQNREKYKDVLTQYVKDFFRDMEISYNRRELNEYIESDIERIEICSHESSDQPSNDRFTLFYLYDLVSSE